MKYSTGHVPRPGARRPMPFSMSRHAAMLRASGARPDSIDLIALAAARGYEPYVVDQGSTGTCFACAPKLALEINLALAGNPLPFRASVLDIATLVHALERAETGDVSDKLWDWGGDPADVATVLSHYGVRAARYRLRTDEASRFCDASPDTVGPDHLPGPGEAGGEEESLLDFETDATHVQIRPYELDALDPVGQAVTTLSDHTVFSLAFRATDADMGAGAGDVLDGRDGAANHDVCIVGYRRDGAAYQFRLQNSWGTGWADGGRIWVSEAFLRSSTARYALTVPLASNPAWKENT